MLRISMAQDLEGGPLGKWATSMMDRDKDMREEDVSQGLPLPDAVLGCSGFLGVGVRGYLSSLCFTTTNKRPQPSRFFYYGKLVAKAVLWMY